MGVLILGLGILYMLLVRGSLVGEGEEGKGKQTGRRTFRDLIRDYRLTGRARRLALRPEAPLIGHSLDELQLRTRYGAHVIGVDRWRKLRRVMVPVSGISEYQVRDVLLIDMSDPEIDIREFCSEARLELMILHGEYFSDQAREVGMVEVSLIPESKLLGKSVREVTFRSSCGLSVVTARRWLASWWTSRCRWGHLAGGGELELYPAAAEPAKGDEMAPAELMNVRTNGLRATFCGRERSVLGINEGGVNVN